MPLSSEELLFKVIPVLSTQRPLVPDGIAVGIIGKPKIVWSGPKKDGQPGYTALCVIPVALDNQEYSDILGVPNPVFNHNIWLDLTAAEGIDESRNFVLGNLTEQFGLNDGTHTLADLEGQPCLASVSTEQGQDGLVRNTIKRIEKIAE